MAAFTPSIEKLQKKLEKEPNSLIFLQLAEEFRKESEYEEALRTCKEGLRRHPNYWSARVAMGRIYLEMGDSERAREELEKVTKAVPDNLLANKLLGDIYMGSGRMADALKRYQIVQMLTPNDQEVVANLQKIEAQMMKTARAETHASPPAPPPPPKVETMVEPATAPAEPEAASAPLDLPSFLEKTAPGVRARTMDLMDSTMPQHSSVIPQAPPPEAMPETSYEPVAVEQPETESDLAAMFLESTHSNEIPVAPSFGAVEEERFPASFTPSQMEGSVAGELVEEPEVVAGQRPEDRTQPMADKEKDDAGEFDGDELTTQTLAELYVQQGLTDKAVKVFQKLLLNDPGNPQIVQRLRELSPADALLSMAAVNEPGSVPEHFGRGGRETTTTSTGRSADDPTDDRRRKITTLENWLAAIRRERS